MKCKSKYNSHKPNHVIRRPNIKRELSKENKITNTEYMINKRSNRKLEQSKKNKISTKHLIKKKVK